jgi:hypothetical protein
VRGVTQANLGVEALLAVARTPEQRAAALTAKRRRA